MQAVARLRRQAAQLLALDDKRTQIAHGRRWDPHALEHAGSVQLGEREGSFGVGLDGHLGHQSDMLGMDHQHGLHVWQHFVMDVERIGGHFEHHGVGSGEVLRNPCGELQVRDPLRAEHRLLLGIHAQRNQVVLVDVEPNEARWRCTSWRHRCLLWFNTGQSGQHDQVRQAGHMPSHTDASSRDSAPQVSGAERDRQTSQRACPSA